MCCTYCSKENLIFLAQFCDEFLVHGVDVEGKKCGIEGPLVTLLGECCPVPVTYGESLRLMRDSYQLY
jgi:phosphoribosylformimino-5-aminoimidazole carboxamide ribotide isomerase